jgi:WD40 repeat protein
MTGFSAVGLSKDRTIAALAWIGGKISVVRLPSLVELWHCFPQLKSILSCTFAPDDSFVLFGKLETALNIAEKKEVPFFHRNEETFISCAFSPNGKRLVTANGSSTIKLWDVAKQSLLSLLCAEIPVAWCSFISTGLFIVGDRNSEDISFNLDTFTAWDDEDLFCSWNAITLQRIDERVLPELKRKEEKASRSKLCKRCFPPAFETQPISKIIYVERCIASEFKKKLYLTCSTGVHNGVECTLAADEVSLNVIENTHFTRLAAWNANVRRNPWPRKISAIEDGLWLYSDSNTLIVIRGLVPKNATWVLWSSFSPDGS